MTNICRYNILSIIFFSIMLGGCAASRDLMEHSSLKTETKMSATVFLDPVPPEQKTILVQVRNTTDKSNFNPKQKIIAKLEDAGYKITNDPNKAHYLLQANVLKVGEGKPDEVQKALSRGYGGAFEGATVGALLGVYSDNPYSSLTGGLAGAAIGTMANSLIKNVTYNAITDIQVSERAGDGIKVSEANKAELKQGTSGSKTVSSKQITNWKRYQTRIASTANKVNLDFAEAEPELINGLAQSISGIFS